MLLHANADEVLSAIGVGRGVDQHRSYSTDRRGAGHLVSRDVRPILRPIASSVTALTTRRVRPACAVRRYANPRFRERKWRPSDCSASRTRSALADSPPTTDGHAPPAANKPFRKQKETLRAWIVLPCRVRIALAFSAPVAATPGGEARAGRAGAIDHFVLAHGAAGRASPEADTRSCGVYLTWLVCRRRRQKSRRSSRFVLTLTRTGRSLARLASLWRTLGAALA